MNRLQDKVAFITGAAQGQGRSHAIRLAQEGADIIAIDACSDQPAVVYPTPSEKDLEDLGHEVRALGRRVVTVKADVRDLDALKGCADAGVAELGRLDIVSANAGIGTGPAASEDLTEDLWRDMIDVNLSGVWRTTTATIPHLKAGGRGGAIVLTSSLGGLKGLQNISHYVAAKHGVVGLMRNLANELGPWGIRVNSIHPTQVNTPMIMNETTYGLFRPDLEKATKDDFAEASQGVHVLPTAWVEPVDISNALVFLASDEARYITGVTLPVDAGANIK